MLRLSLFLVSVLFFFNTTIASAIGSKNSIKSESLIASMIMLECPADTTITCEDFIEPEFTGIPSMDGMDTLLFIDEIIQSCPDPIIIQRTWIAQIDSISADTCSQLITVDIVNSELDALDTIRVQDACIANLDEQIQIGLDLPCSLGIDSITFSTIEEDCNQRTLQANWVLGNQCADTSYNLTQVVIIEDLKVVHNANATIVNDTGSLTGSIMVSSDCPPEDLSYSWSSGDTTTTADSLGAGIYSLEIENAQGCSESFSFTVPGGLNVDTTGMQMDTMGMPMDTTVMPMDTTGMPMDTTGMPMDTTGTPMDTTGMPMDTTGMPMDTTGMPMDTTGMPMDTTGMPMDTTGMPMDTTGMPMDTTGMPMDTTGMPMDTTGMPMDTTGMPMDTTGMPMDTTGMPMDTTGMPMDTTGMPMDTTGMPMDTTGMPMDTTGMPMDTTGMPMDTTGMPMDTTGMPMDTTGMPMDTTGMPMDTTGMPMDTTEMPMDTTGMPMDTTGMPMDTTEMPMDTTGMPMDTIVDVNIDSVTLGSIVNLSITNRDNEGAEIDSLYLIMQDGSSLSATFTGALGTYVIDVGDSLRQIDKICPVINDTAIRDLSVQDVVLGQSIVLQTISSCEEDRLACDVNGNGSVTGADLVLMRNILLGDSDTYPTGTTWIYNKVNSNIGSSGACIDVSNQDKVDAELELTAIKLGDLRCNE